MGWIEVLPVGEDEVAVEELLPFLHLALEIVRRSLCSRMMNGVRIKMRLLFSMASVVCRKSAPSTGMSPRIGISVCECVMRFRMRPPITTVC